MSFWGNLLKIVAIGAFFVATGPFGLAVGPTLVTALRIGGLVAAAIAGLIDRPRLLADRLLLANNTSLEPGTPIPVVYGQGKTGAIVADWFLDPDPIDPAKGPYDYLYYIAALAHGSRLVAGDTQGGIADIHEFWLNNQRAIHSTFIDTTGTPFYNGSWVFPFARIEANFWFHDGRITQNIGDTAIIDDAVGVPAPADVTGSGWNATTDTGKGIVGATFAFVNIEKVLEATKTITSSSAANPSVITTSTAHAYTTGDTVRITGHAGGVVPDINADWVITVLSPTTFSIPVWVTTGGTGGNSRRAFEGFVFSGPPQVSAILQGNMVEDPRSQVSGVNITFANVGSADTITRAAGSFVTDGWVADDRVVVTGSSSNNGTFRVVTVAATVLTMSADDALVNEGPSSGITLTRLAHPANGGDNPALVIRDYLLAPIYGCGFDASFIHEASFATAADYCDEAVTYELGPVTITSSDAGTDRVTTATAHGWATGDRVRISGHSGSTPSLNGDHAAITVTTTTSFTIDGVNITVGGTGGTVSRLEDVTRFTCNGVVDTSRTVESNLEELKTSCRGDLVWEQGQIKLLIRSASAPAASITLDPSNIIGEWSFRQAGSEDKWNVVSATYVEPADGQYKTQTVQWPRVGLSNSYLTEDNNLTSRLDLALPFTTDEVMAQAISQTILKESRYGLAVQCRCTEALLAASVGDLAKVTHPTPGWTDKLFWVMALDLMPDTTVAVNLREYNADAYAFDPMDNRRPNV